MASKFPLFYPLEFSGFIYSQFGLAIFVRFPECISVRKTAKTSRFGHRRKKTAERPLWDLSAFCRLDKLILYLMVSNSKAPVWLLSFPPVMKAKHDGEGAGRQQLLVVVVVQTVSRRQGKSVANLFDNDGHPTNQKVCCIGW